jgi:hypothetical protein
LLLYAADELSDALIIDFCSSILWQPGQKNTWMISVGSTPINVERDHLISSWQSGQIGDFSCSNERLSLSMAALLVARVSLYHA